MSWIHLYESQSLAWRSCRFLDRNILSLSVELRRKSFFFHFHCSFWSPPPFFAAKCRKNPCNFSLFPVKGKKGRKMNNVYSLLIMFRWQGIRCSVLGAETSPMKRHVALWPYWAATLRIWQEAFFWSPSVVEDKPHLHHCWHAILICLKLK